MLAASSLLLLSLTCLAHAQRKEGCWVDVWRVRSRYEPVLAVGGALALPDHETGQLVLPTGGVVLAGCPGAGNSLKLARGLQYVNATCGPTGSLQVCGSRVTPGQLWCEKRSKPSAFKTKRRCGPEGKLDVYELGFNVSRLWLPAIEVCHNTSAANTLYSYHHLFGSLLQFRRRPTSRPSFSPGSESGSLYQGVCPNEAYSGPAVLETLSSALGSVARAQQLLDRSGLSRGHLAPSGDFLLNTLQHASFFYANAAPQWQAFNHGNWLSVEAVLRNHAQRQALDLQVWTGTLGVLSLDGSAELHLAEGRRLSVPRFFWKLVHDPRSGAAVAFVGLNDPFATVEAAQVPLCANVCDKAGWARRNWNRPGKGLVICCEAKELAAAVPGAPKLNATSLLPGPSASPSTRGKVIPEPPSVDVLADKESAILMRTAPAWLLSASADIKVWNQ